VHTCLCVDTGDASVDLSACHGRQLTSCTRTLPLVDHRTSALLLARRQLACILPAACLEIQLEGCRGGSRPLGVIRDVLMIESSEEFSMLLLSWSIPSRFDLLKNELYLLGIRDLYLAIN
jgi:hypothetical protein